jgi:DNA-binding LacI/PurR family transcriptional regulator
MMRSSPSLTPDAMVVMDDHLAEPLADALTEMAVRVPQDLQVVSHWNFPLRYTRQLPFHLLGPDAAELLTRWLETIDRLRRGEPVAERGIVSPIFAEEWSERQAATSAEVSVDQVIARA